MFYTYLTLKDHIDTSLLVGMGLSCRKMAMHFRRSHAAISWELSCNVLL